MLKLIVLLRPYSRYLLILWTAVIISVSSSPSIPSLKIHTEKTDIRLDYLIHFMEYASLAFLTYLAFAGKDFRMPASRYIILTLGLVVFAAADETHQILIPGRTFNPWDLISNLAGVAGGAGFCIMIFRMLNKRIPG